jgi:DNA topoisomerase-2
MNVRDLSVKKIFDNKEASEIRQIMGLEIQKKYKSLEDVKANLRYGKIAFMTDQDLDGSHIKGLCINFFDYLWPELVKLDNFFGFMNTPILKAKKGKKELIFYNEQEYNQYKTENSLDGWKIKYYKGLATSTSSEFKDYFKEKKIVSFGVEDKTCHETIDMAFNKTRADDRKDWLAAYDKDSALDTTQSKITIREFVNKELIHFSKYDCDRSIPNLVDGLKTSLRKILYCVFKRNLTSEIKVAQLGGYVSENSGYHHGEASLMKAIVGMAQNYVGSNNINLLKPNGQFGTRLQGGKDSGSERYIFTEMSKITPYIYRQEDNPVLNYLQDDGETVEPEFYVPIIPMILVNGTTGIGTGFSTDIMNYNPVQIIEYLENKLNGNSTEDITIQPYYEGFKGSIIELTKNKYLCKGKYEFEGKDTVRITELPVGMWTDKYKEILEKMMSMDDKKKSQKDGSFGKGKNGAKSTNIIKSYKEFNTDVEVNFLIKLKPNVYEKYVNIQIDEHINKLEKELHLTTTMTNTNMHLFDQNQKLTKYDNVKEIIDAYMNIRMEYYTKRKAYMLEQLEREVKLLSNKARFIQMQCDDKLDLRRKKKDVVIELLKSHKFDMIDSDTDYKYLRTMPIDSVIEENVEKLLKSRDNKEKEYNSLKNKTNKELWLHELDELKEAYNTHITKTLPKPKKKSVTKTKNVKSKATKKIIKVKKTKIVFEEDNE